MNKEELKKLSPYDTYTEYYNHTVCPYCGREEEQDAESLTYEEGETSEVYCNDCDKYYLQRCISVNFCR